VANEDWKVAKRGTLSHKMLYLKKASH